MLETQHAEGSFPCPAAFGDVRWLLSTAVREGLTPGAAACLQEHVFKNTALQVILSLQGQNPQLLSRTKQQ